MFDELKTFLLGEHPWDCKLVEHRWEDDNLTVWVYTYMIQDFLDYFRWVVDGTNDKELVWLGNSIAIEHFEEWIPDISEEELYELFSRE